MTIFAGVYYWFPKMTGRMYDERLGKWHFWLTFVFVNATFGPMHVIGLEGMPRRVATYAQEFAGMNLFISIASFFLGASTLIFVYNMITSWRGGPRASANPWRGHDARVAGVLAAHRCSTSTACRRSSAVPTSTASPAPCTGSSRRPPVPATVGAGSGAATPHGP